MHRRNGFSIDVEDGISIAMRDRFGVRVPQTRRVVNLTHKILELLERHRVNATFFVLGQVAEAFPELVREIHRNGHEIGVHGYDHIELHKLSRADARDELLRAKTVLEDITGEKARGHRAPRYSVTQDTAWALDLLLELGFEYDSSVLPGSAVAHGWPGQRLDIGPITTPSGSSIVEVPISVLELPGLRVPALGGGYFRLLPLVSTLAIFRRVQAKRPVIVYLHPYEIDDEPYPEMYMRELRRAPLRTRLRMRSFWIGRKSLLRRYDAVLSRFSFGRLDELLRTA